MSRNNPQVHQQFLYQGPLPPPNSMEKYEHILPGAAERIMAMAENQSKHRQDQEKLVVKSSLTDIKLGMFFGFTIAMTAIIGGVYLTAIDKNVEGIGIIVAALAGLVTAFIFTKNKTSKEK